MISESHAVTIKATSQLPLWRTALATSSVTMRPSASRTSSGIPHCRATSTVKCRIVVADSRAAVVWHAAVLAVPARVAGRMSARGATAAII